MLISILMLLFSFLMFGIAYYLLKHTNEPFVQIAQENLIQYKITTRAISILFLITAVFSFITVFLDNKTLSLSALLFGSICAAYYAIFISNKINI
ncbi:hypothetical protein RD055328_07920 [Companilactobacillus sp. RD055328]|uniref:hypothetical protein n=1 Tax=Companilactobacillus sp. RD055328 TaxID=2916634 RepID=UPI001FC7E24D|nr:hypothetical protein [Companilactobacillus sp. RD055328]GKQ42869.1 hypothetical protein RD055328_07920 [Companilactobacillus sp. RD055328]